MLSHISCTAGGSLSPLARGLAHSLPVNLPLMSVFLFPLPPYFDSLGLSQQSAMYHRSQRESTAVVASPASPARAGSESQSQDEQQQLRSQAELQPMSRGLRPVWQTREYCSKCLLAFTFFRRRHHCRNCKPRARPSSVKESVLLRFRFRL